MAWKRAALLVTAVALCMAQTPHAPTVFVDHVAAWPGQDNSDYVAMNHAIDVLNDRLMKLYAEYPDPHANELLDVANKVLDLNNKIDSMNQNEVIDANAVIVLSNAIDAVATEYILGERHVNQTWAWGFANLMVLEFERILWDTPMWKVAFMDEFHVLESKDVSGPFGSSGVRVTRAHSVVAAPADATYEMLTTAVGYQVIDPVSDPADFDKPIETYPYLLCDACSLQAEYAVAEFPAEMGGNRDFVVLNAKLPGRRTFLSKSILHPLHPGGSIYSGVQPPETYIRALNTFGVKTTPINATHCDVAIVNWLDFVGFPVETMNAINELTYIGPLYERIRAKMAELQASD